MKTDILSQKVTGSQFKGETWQYFINQITAYFLPKFNAPLVLTNNSNILTGNFRSSYSDISIERFLIDVKSYPNAEISIETANKGREFKTVIPKELHSHLIDRLKQQK